MEKRWPLPCGELGLQTPPASSPIRTFHPVLAIGSGSQQQMAYMYFVIWSRRRVSMQYWSLLHGARDLSFILDQLVHHSIVGQTQFHY